MNRVPITIRPAPRLVGLIGICTLSATVALPVPSIMGATLGFFGLVVILAAMDWVASRRGPVPEVQRILPEHPVKGRPATIVYRLRCTDDIVMKLDLLDELPAALGGDLLVPGLQLRDGRLLEFSREVLPNRRGTFPLGPLFILSSSRMGFFRIRSESPAGGEIAILPPASMPRRSGLSYRKLHEDLGLKPRLPRGEGSEFESLREYVAGDDPRHIDWRASSRHSRLQVRQYQTERRHTVIVAIDTGRLMGAHVDGVSKLDHAINCAAALARASIGFGDRVGFVAFDRQVRLLVRPKSGRSGAGALVAATSGLQPMGVEPDYRVLVETLARQQKKRALVVVLTDFVEGGASRGLEEYLSLLARRHCVMLVALRDRMLREVDQREPTISRDRIYRRLALQDLVAERETALARIARAGGQVLDLDPAQVTTPVLNRYLAVRESALI